MNNEDKTQLITFYSYKGGVGRTMALANSACQLANKHGLNVIVIDWDLEAPGLHYYFGYSDQDLAGQLGLIDYIEDFVSEVKQGDTAQEPNLNNYLLELKQELKIKIKFGSVRLLTCGRTNANYMVRVQELDWNNFYEKDYGYYIIEKLKSRLRENADIILIDSRAGQSDIGTTPTIQVPDAVVLLFCSNRQSLDGIEQIAHRLKNHDLRKKQDYKELRLLLVPSRVFPKEDRFNVWLENDANRVYERLQKNGVIKHEDQPRGLKECILAVDPRFTFGEELPILSPVTFKSDLKDAYIDLAQVLADLYVGRTLWSTHRSAIEFPEPLIEIERLRKELESAAERGDDHIAASLRFKLSQLDIKLKRYEEAEIMLQASLTYHQNKGDILAASAIIHEIGALRFAQNRYDESWSLFEKALHLKQDVNDLNGQAVTLYEMGRLQYRKGELEESWKYFDKALEIAILNNKTIDQSVVLQMMGNIHRQKNRLTEAENLYNKSMELAKKEGNIKRQAKILFEISNLRNMQARHGHTNFEDAWSLFNEALRLAEQCNDVHLQSILMIEMANMRLKQCHLDKKNKNSLSDESWRLLNQAFELAKKTNNVNNMISILYKMANIQYKKKNYKDALDFYENSLMLLMSNHNKQIEISIYKNILKIFKETIDYAQGNPERNPLIYRAKSLLQRFLESSLEHSNNDNIINNIKLKFNKTLDESLVVPKSE